MRRFWIFIFSVILGFSMQAQEVGLRFGDMDGNNIGIDGVFEIDANSRIHGTISFGDYVGIDALYDFAVNPVFQDSGFYYYAGIGLTSLFASDFKLGVMGEVGFEYRFRTASGLYQRSRGDAPTLPVARWKRGRVILFRSV